VGEECYGTVVLSPRRAAGGGGGMGEKTPPPRRDDSVHLQRNDIGHQVGFAREEVIELAAPDTRRCSDLVESGRPYSALTEEDAGGVEDALHRRTPPICCRPVYHPIALASGSHLYQ